MSLADRYLSRLVAYKEKAPCLLNLAVSCIMISGKLNQALKPSFDLLDSLISSDYNVSLKKPEFIALETNILRSLQFDLQYISPILFLERF